MKYFFIFSILCIAGVQAIEISRVSTMSERTKMYIEECAKELNMPVFKNGGAYSLLEMISYFYPGPKSDQTMCMTPCLMRKNAEFFKLKIHEKLLGDINFIYKIGSGSPKVTHEELRSRVNYCHANESNECEFYKCLDVMNPPFRHLTASLLKPVIVNAIHSKF